MRVLEIGCGESAGPFFDGASEHIALDLDEKAVSISVSRDPRFTPMVADATGMHELPNESIDVVLARNVFGSPLLGMDHRSMVNIMRSHLKWPDYDTAYPEIDARKLAIMEEVGRVLFASGRLVIIEQLTPKVATKFIERIHTGEIDKPQMLSMPTLVDISYVTGANYAE